MFCDAVTNLALRTGRECSLLALWWASTATERLLLGRDSLGGETRRLLCSAAAWRHLSPPGSAAEAFHIRATSGCFTYLRFIVIECFVRPYERLWWWWWWWWWENGVAPCIELPSNTCNWRRFSNFFTHHSFVMVFISSWQSYKRPCLANSAYIWSRKYWKPYSLAS